MSDLTPTNGNGRAWLRHIPLVSALAGLIVASLAAGRLSTKVDLLGDKVAAIEASTKDTGLESRVRLNTENVRTLQADYAGHLDKAGLQWSMLQADIAAIKSAINDLRRSSK